METHKPFIVYADPPKPKPQPKIAHATALNFGDKPKLIPKQAPEDPNDPKKPHTVRHDLSDRIKKERATLGWTQKELAQKACLQASIVNDYESGKAITNQGEIQKILKALDAGLRDKKKSETK
jgi:ribosome-binding protein aMBF1 (putative translation factor)